MAKKTQLSELDTEKLFEIFEEHDNAPKEVEASYNDVPLFLSVFNVKHGKDLIKRATLYVIYKTWAPDPVKRALFYRECDAVLETVKRGNLVTYRVSDNAIKLTKAAYQEYKKIKEKTEDKFNNSVFNRFCEHYRVQRGDFWVEAPLLYFIYDKYNYVLKIDGPAELSKKLFYEFCNKTFEHKTSRSGKMYAITTDILSHFQEGQFERMRKANEKWRQEQK